MNAPIPEHIAPGYGATRTWQAGLTLELQHQPATNRTVLSKMDFYGPLRVQRPFYPEGEVCHLYLLHPPGGMVSGDELSIDISAQPGAHTVVTTPSAGKVYQADSSNVRQRQKVTLNVEGALEWLPQETIIFNGANGCLDTEIHLSENSRFIGWDVFCLGRLAGNYPFLTGTLEQRLQVYRDGVPCLLDRQRLVKTGGEDALFHATWGFGGATVSGTCIATIASEQITELLERVRTQLSGSFACTVKDNLLIIRYLGHSVPDAKRGFIAAWRSLRPVVMGREVTIPRIWHT